jgi:hypothetical protein
VTAELHANRMQCLIRLCVIRCYISVMWRSGVHRPVWLRCQVRTHYLVMYKHGVRYCLNGINLD